MMHVEAVIRLFDPDYQTGRIAARRRYKGNGIFKRGAILQNALDVLRNAQGPLTAREITERLLADRGTTLTPKAMRSLIASVQTCLVNHEGKSVARVGEGMPGQWQIP